MSLVLQSSGGGSITIQEPATASNFTQTLPAGTGTTVVNGVNGSLVSGAAQTASGTSVNFTGIPSWVKRITVTMTDISFAATGVSRIRIGTSGGLATTGYVTTATSINNTPAVTLSSVTDGLATISGSANASVATGQFIIVNITGNTWQCSGFMSRLADNNTIFATGYIALGGTLDQLSLVATTSTFDAGSINILYE
jgi:hypothetical protein